MESQFFADAERSGKATTPAFETKAAQTVRGLRELADFLEWHPVIAEHLSRTSITFNLFATQKEKFREMVRELGAGEKIVVGSYFTVRRTFGCVQLDVFSDREQVCERKVIGTRVVPAHIIPASPETEVPERIEEIVEWDCKPILGGRDE